MADVQMPIESDELPALTRTQKRQLTIARAEEKARQEQKAFEAETKAAGGGRQAKRDAKANAVWNVDNPSSRKRTSSTVEVSEKTKKPRKSAATVDADVHEPVESVPQSKVKVSSTKRKYAAPIIDDSESEVEPVRAPVLPRLDFTNLPPLSANSKAAGKAKQTGAGAKATAPGKAANPTAAKAKGAAAKTKLPPAKIIAYSESEVDSSSSDDEKDSDSEMVDFEDANKEEFLAEVPRIVAKNTVVTPTLDSGSEDDSKMSDAKSAKQLFDSDQESIEIDKPRHRRLISASESDNDFPGAPPRFPIDADDHMLHEAIADALVTIPRGHQSRRSSTSSWSSGRDLRVPDSDAEDDDEAPVKKPRKISAARQKQADLEKPEIRAAPLPVKHEEHGRSIGEEPVRSEASYHPSTRIAYPAPGKKDILLNSQSEELQTVLRTTISNVKRALVFEAAYPPILARAGYARKYLIILDRINILRGDFKRVAVALTPGLFHFAGLSEAKTKELIEKLLKDHRYIFPSDPKTDCLMTEKPFLHPVFPAVMKQAVFNRSFKANNMDLFASTSKKHPKQMELPDAMVALTATAVYASLVEYRATGEHQNIPFTEGAYEDTYENHMKTLADTRDYAPVALHKVLHGLFTQVTDGKSTQPEAGSSATLINLVEVDESD
ncbi:hypothetical protein DFH08DRAFT_970800 [Mycena albidolilacea]|uniref:DUF6532 domain-containing protein n=1 Tax=Mycena albidolilacea TaxID=1033008 RepID=A0AAD6ZFQ1_9AGAR|nr:hypothetical protein DFH08DRAFT_970800 [Mycena albidolilacea]